MRVMQRLKQSSVALAIGLGATLAAGTAQADLLVYEGFDYADGSAVAGQTGGSGWGGEWVSGWHNPSIVSPGLTHPTVIATGNAAIIVIGGSSRPLLAPISGSAFFSVLLHPEAELEGNGWLGISFKNGGNGLFVGKPGGGNSQWAIEHQGGANNGTTTLTGITPTAGQTTLLAGELIFNGNDVTLNLYIDPLASQPANPSATYTYVGLGALSQVGLEAGVWPEAGTTNKMLDEIRIGETWGDVTPIPEPASLGLLAMGGVMLLRRRG